MNSANAPILLVEDDPNDVFLVRRAFRKAGLPEPSHVAGDGDEAVRYLEGRGGYADRSHFPLPRLMLLDLKLPRRSGLEVLAWVREHPSLARLSVVVLTSSRESSDVNRAYDLHVNSYLVKPGDFDSLREMVRALDLFWLQMNEHPAMRHG